MLDSVRAALAKPPSLPPVLLWLVVLLALILGLPGLLLLGYNLALPPLLHAPSMTYTEAFGFTILAALVVGVVAILKE